MATLKSGSVMDSKAIVRCESRLETIRDATRKLIGCTEYNEFASLWYQILVASKSIYSTLEQGSKASVRSNQLFYREKDRFKKDELVQYILIARGAEEHGLEETSELIPEARLLGKSAEGFSARMTDRNGNTFVNCGVAYKIEGAGSRYDPGLRSLDGKPILNEKREKQIVLKSVRDRSKKIYAPPTTHQNEVLTDTSPAHVAQCMLSHLTNFVNEARKFL